MYIIICSIENTWLSWRSGRKVLLTDESGRQQGFRYCSFSRIPEWLRPIPVWTMSIDN